MTNIGVVSFGGALITTFFAPPIKCFSAASVLVKIPVNSKILSALAVSQGIFAGFFSFKILISFPSKM